MAICCFSTAYSQSLYKTPSGKCYHLGDCRMVETVSEKVSVSDIRHYSLTPCKICNPPTVDRIIETNNYEDESVGESTSKQCIGYTQSNRRCRHKTRNSTGYCYQHTEQYNGYARPTSRRTLTGNTQTTTSSRCNARTQSGNSCKRVVKGGGRCYQHKG